MINTIRDRLIRIVDFRNYISFNVEGNNEDRKKYTMNFVHIILFIETQ